MRYGTFYISILYLLQLLSYLVPCSAQPPKIYARRYKAWKNPIDSEGEPTVPEYKGDVAPLHIFNAMTLPQAVRRVPPKEREDCLEMWRENFAQFHQIAPLTKYKEKNQEPQLLEAIRALQKENFRGYERKLFHKELAHFLTSFKTAEEVEDLKKEWKKMNTCRHNASVRVAIKSDPITLQKERDRNKIRAQKARKAARDKATMAGSTKSESDLVGGPSSDGLGYDRSFHNAFFTATATDESDKGFDAYYASQQVGEPSYGNQNHISDSFGYLSSSERENGTSGSIKSTSSHLNHADPECCFGSFAPAHAYAPTNFGQLSDHLPGISSQDAKDISQLPAHHLTSTGYSSGSLSHYHRNDQAYGLSDFNNQILPATQAATHSATFHSQPGWFGTLPNQDTTYRDPHMSRNMYTDYAGQLPYAHDPSRIPHLNIDHTRRQASSHPSPYFLEAQHWQSRQSVASTPNFATINSIASGSFGHHLDLNVPSSLPPSASINHNSRHQYFHPPTPIPTPIQHSQEQHEYIHYEPSQFTVDSQILSNEAHPLAGLNWGESESESAEYMTSSPRINFDSIE